MKERKEIIRLVGLANSQEKLHQLTTIAYEANKNKTNEMNDNVAYELYVATCEELLMKFLEYCKNDKKISKVMAEDFAYNNRSKILLYVNNK